MFKKGLKLIPKEMRTALKSWKQDTGLKPVLDDNQNCTPLRAWYI